MFHAGARDLPKWDRSAHIAAYAADLVALKTIGIVLDVARLARTVNEVVQVYETAKINADVCVSKDQVDVLREIFGNPFRPITLDPSWLTSTVLALAQGIYDEKAFDRMPILADALQDAGCDNEDILNHCQGGDIHVRGCWMIDLLLARL
jgi:hypothetical protein